MISHRSRTEATDLQGEHVNYTPGPWIITSDGQAVYALMPNPDERSIRRGHPADINRFYAGLHCDRACPIEELRANAHLIAAAPPLLEALEAAYLRLLTLGDYTGRHTAEGQSELVDMREAIAAAKNVEGQEVQDWGESIALQRRLGKL